MSKTDDAGAPGSGGGVDETCPYGCAERNCSMHCTRPMPHHGDDCYCEYHLRRAPTPSVPTEMGGGGGNLDTATVPATVPLSATAEGEKCAKRAGQESGLRRAEKMLRERAAVSGGVAKAVREADANLILSWLVGWENVPTESERRQAIPPESPRSGGGAVPVGGRCHDCDALRFSDGSIYHYAGCTIHPTSPPPAEGGGVTLAGDGPGLPPADRDDWNCPKCGKHRTVSPEVMAKMYFAIKDTGCRCWEHIATEAARVRGVLLEGLEKARAAPRLPGSGGARDARERAHTLLGEYAPKGIVDSVSAELERCDEALAESERLRVKAMDFLALANKNTERLRSRLDAPPGDEEALVRAMLLAFHKAPHSKMRAALAVVRGWPGSPAKESKS